jgi:hypothetical protein
LAHAPDEHIHLAEFERGTKQMVALLERLAELWSGCDSAPGGSALARG